MMSKLLLMRRSGSALTLWAVSTSVSFFLFETCSNLFALTGQLVIHWSAAQCGWTAVVCCPLCGIDCQQVVLFLDIFYNVVRWLVTCCSCRVELSWWLDLVFSVVMN